MSPMSFMSYSIAHSLQNTFYVPVKSNFPNQNSDPWEFSSCIFQYASAIYIQRKNKKKNRLESIV